VSGNKLTFGSLLPNVGIAGFDYSNQAPLSSDSTLIIPVHSNTELSAATDGAGNQYSWTRNGTAITDATSSTFTIEDIGRSKMGTYQGSVTNPGVPGLTLMSGEKIVLASADLAGRILESAEVPTTVGEVKLLRIVPTGGYDTTRIVDINPDGTYLLDKVILDDYIMVAIADTLVHIGDLPTYYDNKLFWEEADTLFVNENLSDLDITIIDRPTARPTGEGELTGVLNDNEDSGSGSGRTEINRVKGAGVAVSRKRKIGRPQDEFELTLVAYKYTGDNGEFDFSDLEVGDYALNIQYPGYPMDPNSFVDFSIGQGIAKKVAVDALVTKNQIVVRQLVITGFDEAERRFSVYPNPTTAILNVQVHDNEAGLSYAIINSSGS
jgi:hypothetical protein